MGSRRAVLAALFLGLCGCRGLGTTPKPEQLLASEADGPSPATPGPLDAPLAREVPHDDHEPDHDDHEPDHDDHEPDHDDHEPDHAADAGASDGSPAVRYARLEPSSCEAELDQRSIAFERVPEARGVLAPLRLAGPLKGVTFRSNLPPSKAKTSPYDIYDCRLVLALDDFARILARHGIVEVVHLSVYRPPSRRARLAGAGRRHSGGLAIDAAIFKTKDGRVLSVEKDFQPRRLRARPCPAPNGASELRAIACEASAARIFNVLLTPNFNRAHRNHFHLEVTAGVRWTFVR